ncbi:TetR/AcrR family transcriptional regulator [Nocardioides humilatus]|uniref:TetR/AcrR family transcriptional regulator n=1 Tax=Nocardioides humilatus TaxID=2607660 RepID=A0A5B1L815_9ACTN|nr:TetR/AcrR family transcriptional regulator [Nocardioides humilatus]KAA1416833.1 TetR/AcrR family transcriptional regulator [Nocardioides humilatus]
MTTPGTTPGRAYGGVPAEQRQADRRDRLVEAALAVIGEDGTAGLTVNRVCRTAGLNERYYYESFPTMEDLVVAVAEHAAGRVLSTLAEAIGAAAADARGQATGVIGAGVDLLADDPALRRLVIESAGHPVLARMRADLAQVLVGLIVERGLTTLRIELTPAVQRDADFAARMLLGGLLEVLTDWTSGTLPLDRDELVERCVETFLLVGDHATALSGGR